ncbi:MAG: hypothetical protein Q8K99_04780 [Actinomycetota bacterium]|nr:hypothetical protein [Actinomycetota bacterium]
MDRFGRMTMWQVVAAIVVVDVFAVGMGMGVPFFAILAGFPIGWFLARRFMSAGEGTLSVLRVCLRGSIAVSAGTFVLMLAIWGPRIPLVFGPGFDAAAWGLPLVLYTSTASFWGWMALMIVVSPVLQMLAAAFGVYLTVLSQGSRSNAVDSSG